MTQANVPAYTFHLGDGVTSTFPYSWFVDNPSELQVYAGSVLTTAYTLTGVQTPAGGNVIFYTPPPNGTILFLVRVTPQTQTTDYVSNDPFDAFAHEAALDKLTREVQDLNERFSRIPQYPVTISTSYRNQLLPVPVLLCRPGRLVQRIRRIQTAVFEYADIHECGRFVEGHCHRVAARRDGFGVVDRLPQPCSRRRSDCQGISIPVSVRYARHR